MGVHHVKVRALSFGEDAFERTPDSLQPTCEATAKCLWRLERIFALHVTLAFYELDAHLTDVLTV